MRPLACMLVLSQLLIAAETGAFPEQLGNGIHPYEPVYFALDPGVGGQPLNAKFQLSLAVRVYAAGEREGAGCDGLYGAYSQTSFWDLTTESKPFYDSSYRPEAWWRQETPTWGLADRLGFDVGIGHESNGRSGDESRSINHAFVRLLGEWQAGGLDVYATPRVRCYLEKSDNPDIADYRGHADLVGGVRAPGSWGLGIQARVGDGCDRGSLMLEATHPVSPWTGGRMQGYVYMQWFAGWSETLLAYDERSPQPRLLFGYAIIR